MLIHELFFNLLFIILAQTSQSKPIQDEERIQSYYKSLTDSADQNVRYLEPGGSKTKAIKSVLPTTPDPMNLLTTSLIDTKFDEEIGDENSQSEEEQLASKLVISSSEKDSDPNQKLLSVEEHENLMAFDEKHEVLAKKQIPPVIKASNQAPTIIPQTATVPKPTHPEPPTTPLANNNQDGKHSKKQLDDKNDTKQKTIAVVEKTKQQQTYNGKSLNPLNQGAEMLDNQPQEEHDQHFEEKSRVTQGGNVYEGQLHGIDADAPISIDLTTQSPLSPENTTPKPTETKQNSVLDKMSNVFQAIMCSRGDCADVFVNSATESTNPRELKEMTIIRRVRHDQSIIEVKCKCGANKTN